MIAVFQYFLLVFRGDFPDENGFHATTPSKNHVACTIAYHDGSTEVKERKIMLRLQSHACLRFAAMTTAASEMGADINFVYVQSFVVECFT